MFQNDYAVWLLSDDIKPPHSEKILIDWPRHDIKTYRNYVHACNAEGLHVSILEMMDWGCRAIQQVGRDDGRLPDVVHELYRGYCDGLPRNHDTERVVELLMEVVELLYVCFWDEAEAFFTAHKQVWVACADESGIILEAYLNVPIR